MDPELIVCVTVKAYNKRVLFKYIHFHNIINFYTYICHVYRLNILPGSCRGVIFCVDILSFRASVDLQRRNIDRANETEF